MKYIVFTLLLFFISFDAVLAQEATLEPSVTAAALDAAPAADLIADAVNKLDIISQTHTMLFLIAVLLIGLIIYMIYALQRQGDVSAQRIVSLFNLIADRLPIQQIGDMAYNAADKLEADAARTKEIVDDVVAALMKRGVEMIFPRASDDTKPADEQD